MVPEKVKIALDRWVNELDPSKEQFRHHQVEAMWTYRNLELKNTELLKELLKCENYHARAAAAKQLRHWHQYLSNGNDLLEKAAKDENGLVRMEAAIACSYIGTKEAFNILKKMIAYPNEKHLSYSIITALGSKTIRKFWDPKNVNSEHPKLHNYYQKVNRNKFNRIYQSKIQNLIVKKIYLRLKLSA